MKSSNALKCISISWMIFFFWKSPQPSDNWVPQNQVSHFEAAICELAPKGPWDNFLIGWAIACIQNSPNRRANRRILAGIPFMNGAMANRHLEWSPAIYTSSFVCASFLIASFFLCTLADVFFGSITAVLKNILRQAGDHSSERFAFKCLNLVNGKLPANVLRPAFNLT